MPEVPQAVAATELPTRVMRLEPKFFSYVLSLLVIGTYWIVHYGTFRYIVDYDRGLLWLNLLLLLSISFVPFPTALLGEYGDQQFAMVLYALSLAVPRLLLASIWWHAIRKSLMNERLDRGMAQYQLLRSLLIPAVFLLSIIISFFSVRVAILSWLLMFAVDSVL